MIIIRNSWCEVLTPFLSLTFALAIEETPDLSRHTQKSHASIRKSSPRSNPIPDDQLMALLPLSVQKELQTCPSKKLLVVFSGPKCIPCKTLEQKTLSAPAVRQKLDEYIVVKADIDRDKELADRFEVLSLPTILLTDCMGKPIHIIEGLIGPDELLDVLAGPPTGDPRIVRPSIPQEVGIKEKANYSVWYALAEGPRWQQATWASHTDLIKSLSELGHQTHISHIHRRDFAQNYRLAKENASLPSLILADRTGLALDKLVESGEIIPILSDQLVWGDNDEGHPDFSRLQIFTPKESDRTQVREALSKLARVDPKKDSIPFSGSLADRIAAENVAQRTLQAYLKGDKIALKTVEHPGSNQFKRCVQPNSSIQLRNIISESVGVFGNSQIALVLGNATVFSEKEMQMDPYLAVLAKNGNDWKAIAMSFGSYSEREFANGQKKTGNSGAAQKSIRTIIESTPKLQTPSNATPGEWKLSRPVDFHLRLLFHHSHSWPGARMRFLDTAPGIYRDNGDEGVGPDEGWVVQTIGK